MMKTALTVWANRISPVFDAASMLMIAEFGDSRIQSRLYEPFDPDRPSHLAARLLRLHVSTLICGAISQRPAMLLEAGGIRLIPFITGRAEKVLQAYVRAMPITPAFQMPGCQCRKRQRWQESAKNRTDMNFRNNKEVMKMPGKDQTGPQGQGAASGRGKGGGSKASNTGQGKGRGRGQGTGQGQGRGQGQGQGRGRCNQP
jgi:predicted Fe-Mo cluster-binding NifX family protein